jgi:Coenzyme PQQ synthesis protein D (PqqD)
MGDDCVTAVFIARAPRLAARKDGGEMVILSADDSSLYVLNAVATAVWEAADGRTSVDAIVADVICRDFEIDRESAARDVDAFVRDLASHGILRTSDMAFAEVAGEDNDSKEMA